MAGKATAVRMLLRLALAVVLGAVGPMLLSPPPGALIGGGLAYAAVTCSQPPEPGPVATGLPWHLQRYALERLTGIASGDGVLVGVIDSGVDVRHPQLADAVVAGADALDPAGNDGRADCEGHGTSVASLIAGRPAAGVQFRGIAPRAQILPVRVSERRQIDGQARGRSVTLAGLGAAIRTAVDRRVRVLNLSLAAYGADDPELRAAIEYAVSRDVVVVAAAGNLHDQTGQGRSDPVPYPAAYPGVLGVGAIGPDGLRLGTSEVGDWVDLTAPGGEIVAAGPVRGHVLGNGTSFAAPQVAAAAALVRQYYPRLNAAQVAARLIATADPAPGGAAEYGAGVVNPYRAVTSRLEGAPEQLAALPAPDPTVDQNVASRWNPALVVAGLGAVVAVVIALAGAALPRGTRRRWRPGLRPDPPSGSPDS